MHQANFVQIEITTVCNYRCFYCAGRDMPQRHMPMDTFLAILDRQPKTVKQVSLQGEGEPTAHPQFRAMVAAVVARGFVPYTITNASLIRDPVFFAASFPLLGVSIDSLDPAEADRIGRIKLHRALRGVEKLLETMGARRLIIHTVDCGQPIQELRQWVASTGFLQHIVQPLQGKDDYANRYPLPAKADTENKAAQPATCRFLVRDISRYYALDGSELPCCFIKDTREFRSIDQLRADLAAGQNPAPCRGCAEIVPLRR